MYDSRQAHSTPQNLPSRRWCLPRNLSSVSQGIYIWRTRVASSQSRTQGNVRSSPMRRHPHKATRFKLSQTTVFPSITIAAMTLICELQVQGRFVHLLVNHCKVDEWRWKICLPNYDIIDEGAMPSRLAAQVASQLPLEKWLHRKYKGQAAVFEYRWTEPGKTS